MEPLPCLRDVELIHLSKDIPHNSYSELCDAMGCPYNLNQSILANHRGNYNEAMTEILTNWNTDQAETSQSRSNLTRKLHAVKLGGLGTKLSKGEYLPKKQDPHEQEATPLQSYSAHIHIPPPVADIPVINTVITLNEVLERRYTDPARFAEDIVLRNQGFLPELKRRDSSSRSFYEMENSRHDIFKSPTRRLTVSGSNTAELTSLCRSLAYDWAKQNRASALSDMEHLFELSADDIKPNQTIENAIKDQLFTDLDEVDEALIRQLLKDRPDGITILLDGFNGKNCGDNIMDVLSGRTLPEVTVMVTTKPRYSTMLHRMTPGGYDRIDMH